MATIPTPGGVLRHVRKTITFDGSAGGGEWGSPVTVMTGTGAYVIALYSIRCTEDLVIDANTRFRFSSSAGTICPVRQLAVAGEFAVESDFANEGQHLAVPHFGGVQDGLGGPMAVIGGDLEFVISEDD